MSISIQSSMVRWKEWIPLVTQQQRLRNVIQIIGYNINVDKAEKEKDIFYYYTLHLSTMCAPFYTSEKIAKQNPMWSEVSFSSAYGSVTGVVIRIWKHYDEGDSVVTMWTVYFSGLSYIGPQLFSSDALEFCSNTIVFCMHGGYFTSSDFFKVDQPTIARITAITVPNTDVRKSYTLDLLSRLHSTQRSVKELSEEAHKLHGKILTGDYSMSNKFNSREKSLFLRKLLNQSKPAKISLNQLLEMRKKIECTKFRVQLLHEERNRKQSELRNIISHRNKLDEFKQEEECELLTQHHTLEQNMQCIKEKRRIYFDMRQVLTNTNSQFTFRQQQLITELSYIYPIHKISDAQYTICNIHLPNSEDLAGRDDLQLAVALGFTCHLIQIMSYLINIPLRYAVIHAGSNSKIVDCITAKIPDKDREFPLFSRGKDRLKFDYAVYLLNKNIAQLQWYCGISTHDLRMTLPNLHSLYQFFSISTCIKQNITPRISKTINVGNLKEQRRATPTSYSLDKGLDKWDGNEANCNSKPTSPYNTSEPSLSSHIEVSHLKSNTLKSSYNNNCLENMEGNIIITNQQTDNVSTT